MPLLTCSICQVPLKDYRSKKCRSCSKSGRDNPNWGKLGETHPNYKGGYINTNGYKVVGHNGIKIYEHRYVMEIYLGRKLGWDDVIHHINEDKLDNRIENLSLTNHSEHVKLHNPRLGTGAVRWLSERIVTEINIRSIYTDGFGGSDFLFSDT